MIIKNLDWKWKGSWMTQKPIGIVIHSMGRFLDDTGKRTSNTLFAPDFLLKWNLSAHALVEPNALIYLCSPTTKEAWHAGKSKWNGQSGLNSNYLGIEILIDGVWNYKTHREIIQDPDAFDESQYPATVDLCKFWMKEYPTIKMDNIVRHSEVSGPDVRDDYKVDPGSGFDWNEFKDMLK